ncbi:MAG: murein biosynthesis integral membrane protein MurJ [Holosporaceae bacterium]|jgi:putative peptidoglycan lipid II flippase|nr:murein biosynthesis integral membrane protein MurJ [Holosporaceae bacterium]
MSLIKNVATVGGWTLVYRISSFIRDIVQSSILGVGVFSDVFNLSFKFANSLRKLFAEGAFNASFLPIFARSLKNDGREEAQKIASQIFTRLTLLVSFFSIVCLIFFRQIMYVFGAGIDPLGEEFGHLVSVGRICSPYVATSFLAALFGGILNALNRFAMPAAAQLTLNICVIIALFSGALFFPDTAYTMAWATFLSGIVQVLILWADVRHNGFRIGFDFSPIKSEVRTFFGKLCSGAIGSGVLQLNILLDFVLLSFLPTGSLSYFYYVDHIHQFPIGILGISFGIVLLPPLVEAINDKNNAVAQERMNLGLLFSFLFTLPTAVILASASEPVIGAVYGRGNFTPEHVAAASPTLIAFSLGLPAYMATKVLSSAFFANKDTRTPFIGGMIAIFANLLLIPLFMPYLKHTGVALATTLSSWCNWIYMASRLKKLWGICIDKPTVKECAKQLAVSAIMLAVVLALNKYLTARYAAGSAAKNIALLTVIGIGTATFLIFGKIIGIFSFLEKIKSPESRKCLKTPSTSPNQKSVKAS